MDEPLVRIEKADAVTTVILDRSHRRNAVNNDFIRSIIDACETVAEDTGSRVVIFRASGPDFSVGADIDQVKPSLNDSLPNLLRERRDAELGARLLRTIREIPQPTVCAINGVAVGAGACIAIACDFRVAESSARLGFSEVRMAMNLMWGAVPAVVELVGPSRAKRMLMSGRLYEAELLENWGLIDQVCASDELETLSKLWAHDFAALPPVAVQMIKRSINRYSLALGESISHMDSDQWLLTTRSDDFREAVAAFLEKRTGKFVGS